MDGLTLDSIPEYAGMENFKAETYEPPVTPEDKPDVVEVKGQPAEPVEEPEDAGTVTEEVKADADTTAEPVEAEAVPVKEPEEPAVTTTDLNVLQMACDALGITEADPAKQAEAVKAATAEAQTRRQAETQTAEQKRMEAAEDSFKRSAAATTHAAVLDVLKDAGWSVDKDGKNIWDPKTWADDYDEPEAYVKGLTDAYNELSASPLTIAYYEGKVTEVKAAYEASQAKIGETLAKYPNHDPQVAALCRDNNVDPTIIEQVARYTHEHTSKAIATTNSALVAAQARIADLEAQTSGHDAALKAAIADERKRILAEMGKPNPASIGTGAMSPTETGAYKSTGISGGIWDRIPKA